jgi:hypothetical protein
MTVDGAEQDGLNILLVVDRREHCVEVRVAVV